MSKSELHDWECEIEELSGNNTDKMLGIARDIYKTAFVRGRNSMTWEQTRWIPVSEKLPEKNVEVLATTEWGAVTIAEMYSANDWFIHEGTTNAEADEIVAWMPLPEPYKADNRTEQGLAYADQDTMMPAT